MAVQEESVTSEMEPVPVRKKIWHSLVFKVTLLIVLAIVAVSASTNFVIYYLSYNALQHEFENKLMMIASNAAVIIDAEKLRSLQSPKDEGGPVYLELQKKLQLIKKASLGKIRYIYSIGRRGHSYFYVLDAVPIKSEDHSKIGDDFSVKDFPVARVGFSHPVAEKKVIYDKDFHVWSQSGYAPIKDSHGQVIGMLGVDIDATTLKKDEAELFRARMIALLTCIVLALILGVYFSKYLTRPILILTQGTHKIAEGDLETVVSISRNDEFGELAASFNAMTRDLKITHSRLQEYNLELEEKVRQRTAQLQEINKEIKDILDNMSQAIFTIGNDFQFNDQHSRFAYEIFGRTQFTGKSLLDLFFRGADQDKNCENMRSWLERAFQDASVRWENLEPLQPVRDFSIQVKNSADQDEIKYIRVNFSPITDGTRPDGTECITKLMVIVQDITETKTLELQMEQKEQEYKDNLNQIIEVIKMDQELFKDFIAECQDTLSGFEPKLIQLKTDRSNPDLINDLFRIMHSIKGNARFFKLERIAGEAHAIENIFSGIRKGETAMTDALLDEVFLKLDHFNALFNETLDIYNKITNGKNLDTGKTRTEERRKEESEVIKIRVEELNRLTDLIKKADRLILGDGTRDPETSINGAQTEEIEQLFRETQTQLLSLRKIPLSKLFARLPRMTRDISNELNKKVKLIVRGEELVIDKQIFDKIGDPLIHILRNSLDHGIEKPAERTALGKPEEGTIEVAAEQSETLFKLMIADDGAGLDADRIKAKAVLKGLITAEAAMNLPDQEVFQLIFHPGFSTNDKVTEISGRGVGMDVVKTSVEELKGTIELTSVKDQGLKIWMRIPLEA